MSPIADTAYVTSKGQVVVPARLRRKFGIKAGTRLNFQEENGRIVVQPVTKEYISSFRGIFKLKPGEKSAVQELLEDRARERTREDREIEADRQR
jgi:AbrB family looped-hinge helix DNA binding protein